MFDLKSAIDRYNKFEERHRHRVQSILYEIEAALPLQPGKTAHVRIGLTFQKFGAHGLPLDSHQEYRLDVLRFLHGLNVVTEFSTSSDSKTISVHVDIEAFKSFKENANPNFREISEPMQKALAALSPQPPKPKPPRPLFELHPALKLFQELPKINKDKVWITLCDLDEAPHGKPDIQYYPGMVQATIYERFLRTTRLIPHKNMTATYRRHALDFLCNTNMVANRNFGSSVPESLNIWFDPSALKAFKSAVEKIFTPEEIAVPGNKVTPKSEGVAKSQENDSKNVLYRVRYTPNREVLVNEFLLAKVDFNSENDNIFSFLIETPNRTVGSDEIAKVLGNTPPKKSLHKVVENLGFRGDLKTAFFGMSKAGILFRNPVTRELLEELGIHRIKLPLK